MIIGGRVTVSSLLVVLLVLVAETPVLTQSMPKECFLEAKTGPCRAYFVRYYFNSIKGICEEFVYGGCLGNMNNFSSKGDCQALCHNRVDHSSQWWRWVTRR